MLKQVLGVDPRPAELDVVSKLHRYQQLVAEDKWDTDDALQLREALDQWGAEHEPELSRLAKALLRKNGSNQWPRFFTAIRGYLGSAAEEQLRAISYGG